MYAVTARLPSDAKCVQVAQYAIEKSSKPHIDHCHVSGVVRGLLCLTCNTGLGMFGDSVNLLDAAKQYLQLRGAPTVKGHSVPASVSADNSSESIH